MHYHLVGVGGVGMSALAQVLVAEGHDVSGSDRALAADADETPIVFSQLDKGGIGLLPQNGSGVTPATTAVVVSTAIEENNPDLIQASALDIPVMHRAELLGEIANTHACIAITGTSGKTKSPCSPTTSNRPVAGWRMETGSTSAAGAAIV